MAATDTTRTDFLLDRRVAGALRVAPPKWGVSPHVPGGYAALNENEA